MPTPPREKERENQFSIKPMTRLARTKAPVTKQSLTSYARTIDPKKQRAKWLTQTAAKAAFKRLARRLQQGSHRCQAGRPVLTRAACEAEKRADIGQGMSHISHACLSCFVYSNLAPTPWHGEVRRATRTLRCVACPTCSHPGVTNTGVRRAAPLWRTLRANHTPQPSQVEFSCLAVCSLSRRVLGSRSIDPLHSQVHACIHVLILASLMYLVLTQTYKLRILSR